MRGKSWVLFILLACFPLLRGIANSEGADLGLVGKTVPTFEVQDLSGVKTGSERLSRDGKVTVVNFWGLRCSSCLEEIPQLNTLHAKYADRVVLLGVNVDGVDGNALRSHIAKMKIDIRYPVVADPDFRMADAFKMAAAPLTVVIDRSGIVRYRHDGYSPGDEKEIDKAIMNIIEP